MASITDSRSLAEERILKLEQFAADEEEWLARMGQKIARMERMMSMLTEFEELQQGDEDPEKHAAAQALRERIAALRAESA